MASVEQMSKMLAVIQFGSNFGDKIGSYFTDFYPVINSEQSDLAELLKRTYQEAINLNLGKQYKLYNYGAVFAFDFWRQKNEDVGLKIKASEADVKTYLLEKSIHKDNLDEYFLDQISAMAPELLVCFSQANSLVLHGMVDVLVPLKLAKQRMISNCN